MKTERPGWRPSGRGREETTRVATTSSWSRRREARRESRCRTIAGTASARPSARAIPSRTWSFGGGCVRREGGEREERATLLEPARRTVAEGDRTSGSRWTARDRDHRTHLKPPG